SIPVTIRNSGNTEGEYALMASNDFFHLSERYSIRIPPGKDTSFFIPIEMSEARYSQLRRQDVNISVKNEKGEVISMIQQVSRVGHLIKDHPSAFLDMPLQLELGVNYQGEDVPSQY